MQTVAMTVCDLWGWVVKNPEISVAAVALAFWGFRYALGSKCHHLTCWSIWKFNLHQFEGPYLPQRVANRDSADYGKVLYYAQECQRCGSPSRDTHPALQEIRLSTTITDGVDIGRSEAGIGESIDKDSVTEVARLGADPDEISEHARWTAETKRTLNKR